MARHIIKSWHQYIHMVSTLSVTIFLAVPHALKLEDVARSRRPGSYCASGEFGRQSGGQKGSLIQSLISHTTRTSIQRELSGARTKSIDAMNVASRSDALPFTHAFQKHLGFLAAAC